MIRIVQPGREIWARWGEEFLHCWSVLTAVTRFSRDTKIAYSANFVT